MRTRRTAAGLVRRTKNLGVKANVRRKSAAQARERLVTITDDVWLIQPAILLASGSDLVIVCDSAGILAGVVTKTDVVSSQNQAIKEQDWLAGHVGFEPAKSF